jgi:neutral ceramidase
MRIVTERKVRFTRTHTRVYNLKLTKDARRLIQAARDACRDVRISAFVSGRRYGRKRDDQRTTLIRHSKTLKHGRTSGCRAPGAPGAPGVPGTPGATPGQGGPGLSAPGTPVPPAPPVPTPMFAYTARSLVFGPDPNHALQIIADPDENGYAKTFVPSQGIHTRIRARAVVIEAGGKKYALAMVDLGGHPYTFNQEVARRIAATGVTSDRLFVSSTHTHASSGAIWSADNSGYAFVGGDAYDPRVFDMVVSGVVEAITEANKNLQPARVGVGTSQLFGASSNREHDAFKLNPDAPANEKESSRQAIDPRVTAIRVDDARGAPLAVWSNFAIHPTSLGDDNLLFSGDNVATAERLVEEEMLRDATAQGRAPARRPVNVWTNGTEGDITENDDVERDPDLPNDDAHSALQHSTGGFAGANSSGRKVSAGILAAWREAGANMSGSPVVDVRRTFMEFDGSDGSSQIPVLGAGGIVGGEGPGPQPDGGCAAVPNPFPNQAPKQFLFGGPGIVPNVHPVSLMRIGPLAVAAFPTEIATIAGRRIRNQIQGIAAAQAPAGTIIAGLTNSYNSYLATPEEYDHCTYFGSFTLWGRNQLGVYQRTGEALAKSLFGGQALPSAAEPTAPSPPTPNQPSVRPTPNAGDAITHPSDNVNRLQQAVFKFAGGDPAIDAPRTKAFVTLEYRPGTSGSFRAVATEDSVMDTTQHASDDSWTETWQFTECDALGQYRFVARGQAMPDGAYTATSEPFNLRAATIKSYSTTVSGGVARVRAEYQGLPNPALATLARRVRHGIAILRVTRPGGASEEIIAPIDPRGLEFRASVPDGASVSVVSIEDACGNTGR